MVVEVLSSDDLVEIEDAPAQGALASGMLLGRYEVLLPIAAGGMAKVWAARLVGQRGFSKLVAIKTILPHLAAEPLFERMFLEEARIASRVHHPNVCEIYDFGEERGILYLAMEWAAGESLARVLHKHSKTSTPIDARIAARIVADACAGLHAAHELVDDEGAPLGIVHRDVSPQNILLGEGGIVKVVDFGVAKALNGSTEQTAGFLKGKLAYMAPEYVASSTADRRSDVFSMGVVLYEATLGRLPFTGDRDAMVMEEILRCAPPKPREIVAGYPRELEWIVMRALAHDPSARFATAEEMRLALEGWLARSGPPVMESAVAKLVESRVGDAIEARRGRLRDTIRALGEPGSVSQMLSSPPPNGPLPPPGFDDEATIVSSGPPPIAVSMPPGAPRPAAPPRAEEGGGRLLVLAGVALAMLVVLGIVGKVAASRPTTRSSLSAAGTPAAAPAIDEARDVVLSESRAIVETEIVAATDAIELPDEPPVIPADERPSAPAPARVPSEPAELPPNPY
jgi:serine/threonine-protein kinase